MLTSIWPKKKRFRGKRVNNIARDKIRNFNVALTNAFPRFLLAFASTFDWIVGLSVSFAISQSDNLGFGFFGVLVSACASF